MPKKKDAIDWPDSSHVQLKVPSGWCITNHHSDCPHKTKSGICGCQCHREEQK